ncbi:molybdopterin-dependent oxidoreductase [Kineosporia sp. NBRC 101731]|uniref:molybdopterin-dependent oxidoreductase n=1 Tax=Kineosporia sp. NBRC 101731 TaxID=3032199 RepID=UPI0024A4EB27|nr:molybdopterin-dependent oxidoreductase [Kineosporia sp. NBRC 101731]GLY29197.1 dimethylsulfoxide reductase [Kineosporia sp. NBRC 101731]
MTSDRTYSHTSHWGSFTAVVRDGRIVQARPPAADPDPSPLLASIPDTVHSDLRVTAPAVRRSWLEQGPGARTDRRGAEEFVEVDWDTALDLVAAELDRVRTTHGNQAIFGGSYGWSSAGRVHHAKSQLKRFLNSIGGFTDGRGTYSFGTATALLPHVVGDPAMVSGEVTTWGRLEGATTLWVAFGGVPLRTAQSQSGGVSRHEQRYRMLGMSRTGACFVNVSPLRDDLDPDLDPQWLALRANTDTALMLGLAHTLERDGLADERFLARYTHGYATFRRYLLGESDGQPKNAAWAAGICGLPEHQIVDLAHRMATNRTFITTTWSLQRAEYGEQPYWMTITLAAMLGQIGLDGGGFSFGYGNSATTGAAKLPFASPSLPTGRRRCDSWIPVARISDMLENPGGSYQYDGTTRTYPDIRMVYWAGGNPFHHHQDLNRLSAAWRRPETVVVHEPWWTATARRADIVLPATSTLERNDIGASSRDRVLVAMKRALEPQAGARDDYAIFTGLADRLGVLEEFTQGRDEMGWVRFLYDSTRERAADHDIRLPDFATFWEQGEAVIEHEAEHTLLADFRADPLAHPLRTPSGLIEITSDVVAGFGYDDCPGHPVWLEPREWAGSELAATYPLHLISNQPKHRLHSQLDAGPVSRAAKVAGREPVRLNPGDAAQRGIGDGDLVEVFNDRGRVLAGAVLADEVRTGVVQLATGAWYDPIDPSATEGSPDRHGNPNVLTRDFGTSRLGQGPSAHSTLVEIRVAGSDPGAVRVHTPPPHQR